MTDMPKTMSILLASGSPRRRSLMELTGWEIIICPVEVDELPQQGESAEELVRRLATTKLMKAADTSDNCGVILAADTVVADGEHLLGKPTGTAEAREMLMALRGRSHTVLTTVALCDKDVDNMAVETCETVVPMREYGLDELDAYIATGLPLDKAGAYGIQDDDFSPVDLGNLHGCYANVMGLPLCHLIIAMRRFERSAPVNVPEACQGYTGFTCPVYHEILGEQV